MLAREGGVLRNLNKIKGKRNKQDSVTRVREGSGGGTRTPDTRIMIPLL